MEPVRTESMCVGGCIGVVETRWRCILGWLLQCKEKGVWSVPRGTKGHYANLVDKEKGDHVSLLYH